MPLVETTVHRRSASDRRRAKKMRKLRARRYHPPRNAAQKRADKLRSKAMRRGGLARKIGRLRSSLDLPATVTDAVLQHRQEFVLMLLEAGRELQKADPDADARSFVKQYLDRSPLFSQTDSGLAALEFEEWLRENEPDIYSKILETVLYPDDPNFSVIFVDPLRNDELRRMTERMKDIASWTVMVRHGDTDPEEGFVSDVTILECRPKPAAAASGRKRLKRPKTAWADANDRATTLGQSGGASPQMRESALLGDRGAVSLGGPCVYLPGFPDGDLSEAVVLSGGTGLPSVDHVHHLWDYKPGLELASTHTSGPYYEKDGRLLSRLGSWAVESRGDDGCTAVVLGAVYSIPHNLDDVRETVDFILGLYRDLPEEGDMMVQAFLEEYAEEHGTPVFRVEEPIMEDVPNANGLAAFALKSAKTGKGEVAMRFMNTARGLRTRQIDGTYDGGRAKQAFYHTAVAASRQWARENGQRGAFEDTTIKAAAVKLLSAYHRMKHAFDKVVSPRAQRKLQAKGEGGGVQSCGLLAGSDRLYSSVPATGMLDESVSLLLTDPSILGILHGNTEALYERDGTVFRRNGLRLLEAVTVAGPESPITTLGWASRVNVPAPFDSPWDREETQRAARMMDAPANAATMYAPLSVPFDRVSREAFGQPAPEAVIQSYPWDTEVAKFGMREGKQRGENLLINADGEGDGKKAPSSSPSGGRKPGKTELTTATCPKCGRSEKIKKGKSPDDMLCPVCKVRMVGLDSDDGAGSGATEGRHARFSVTPGFTVSEGIGMVPGPWKGRPFRPHDDKDFYSSLGLLPGYRKTPRPYGFKVGERVLVAPDSLVEAGYPALGSVFRFSWRNLGPYVLEAYTATQRDDGVVEWAVGVTDPARGEAWDIVLAATEEGTTNVYLTPDRFWVVSERSIEELRMPGMAARTGMKPSSKGRTKPTGRSGQTSLGRPRRYPARRSRMSTRRDETARQELRR